MEQGQNMLYNNLSNMQDECKKCIHFHVMIMMKDGNTFDGIIEKVDNENLDMMVGEDIMEGEGESQLEGQRQYHGYGRPRRRFRRFRRRRFPLGALAALSLINYPYVAPPYPYYPYYPY
jgi:small nuclear ribonucleoprotein (snRNP)-like protein